MATTYRSRKANISSRRNDIDISLRGKQIKIDRVNQKITVPHETRIAVPVFRRIHRCTGPISIFRYSSTKSLWRMATDNSAINTRHVSPPWKSEIYVRKNSLHVTSDAEDFEKKKNRLPTNSAINCLASKFSVVTTILFRWCDRISAKSCCRYMRLRSGVHRIS